MTMPLTQDLLQDKELVLWYVNVGITRSSLIIHAVMQKPTNTRENMSLHNFFLIGSFEKTCQKCRLFPGLVLSSVSWPVEPVIKK